MVSLEWFNDLYGQPVTLVLDLSDDHLIEALHASLSADCEHSVVSNFELIAVGFSELQLRLLLFVDALVVLTERAGLLLNLVRLLDRGMMA